MNRAEDEMLDTSLDMGWVETLQKTLADTNFRDGNREPTIYKVPDILKSVDPQAYEPLLVSLGPYHCGKPQLESMNQLKWKYLKFVLEQNPGVTLVNYLDQIKKLETRARDAYSEEVNMCSNRFVQMMLLDGCFVMLTIRAHTFKMQISKESTMWTQIEVLEDIFKLENQLPFFLLETLYESAFPSGPPFRCLTFEFICMHTSSKTEYPSPNETYHHIIHFFLSCIDPTKNHGNGNDNGNGNQSSRFGFLGRSKLAKTVVSFPPKLCSSLLSQKKTFTVRDGNSGEDHHVLDDVSWIPNGDDNRSSTFGFLRCSKLAKTVVSFPPKLCSSLLSQVKKKFTVQDGNSGEDHHVLDSTWIPSATVLNEAGIHFVRKQNAKSFLDITFHSGKLEIPRLQIDDSTNSLLRNLIAYEQCSMSSETHVTSYTELMDYLIDSVADLELLQQDDIIINDLGDNQQAATLFNKICLHVISSGSDSYLVDVINAINKHRNTRCNKWRAGLRRKYFGNPWAFISLVGALVLFGLTAVQTIYTALSYYAK